MGEALEAWTRIDASGPETLIGASGVATLIGASGVETWIGTSAVETLIGASGVETRIVTSAVETSSGISGVETPIGASEEEACSGASGMETLIAAAEEFVRNAVEQQGVDGSHDFWHIDRVRKMALRLAGAEGLPAKDHHVIELAALLHDVEDYKYSDPTMSNRPTVAGFFAAHNVDPGLARRITAIISGVGFKDELLGPPSHMSAELAVVQDADRLDAIGAIGIARCFTFGGRFGRTLHDPAMAVRKGLTQQEYIRGKRQQTTLNHFYEKLLKLKGLMKTESGRQIAEERHAYMLDYLNRFKQEWEGCA